MRCIREIYGAGGGNPVYSFEFFTPRSPEADVQFFARTLPALLRFAPAYCSVTYGAGGSTRETTLAMVDRIQREAQVPCMMHLTCVGATREEIGRLLDQARALGIANLLALRGDPPSGATAFTPPPGGLQYAHELVSLARDRGGFSIGVAGFPEGHVECREGKHADWRRLKEKIERGADFVITQLFFENAWFYEFRDHLVDRLGVTVPIVPGVIPIVSGTQIKRILGLCGATLPAALRRELDALGNDDDAVAAFGIDHAAAQCRDLLQQGVPGIHFYTMNRAQPVMLVLDRLGVPIRAGTPAGEPSPRKEIGPCT